MSAIKAYTPYKAIQRNPTKQRKIASFRCSVLYAFVPRSGTVRAQFPRLTLHNIGRNFLTILRRRTEMRNMLFAVVLLCFSSLVSADTVSPPPGVDLCAQYNICSAPTIIEVELSGKGTDIWTDVIALHEVSQPNWFYFVDGTSLPPGSVWMTFLWPSGQVGLSTPLTWRADTPDPAPVDVPEPGSLVLICLSLGIAVTSRWKGRTPTQ